MMPEEWPLAAPAADRPVESARTRGSRRLASVRRDFFLDPAHRLTEQERALMTAMLHDLVSTAAGEVLAALPAYAGQAPDPADLALRLSRAGLLDREALVSLLLRRALSVSRREVCAPEGLKKDKLSFDLCRQK